MKLRRLCAAVLLLLLCMTLPAYATENVEPPPHKEPPPLTEAPSEQDAPAIAPPPHKEPPPDAPPPPGDYNPIIDLCLDSKGGTFRNHLGMDLYDASMSATPGTTLASTGYKIDRITCVGKTFQGWIAYNAVTGAAISGLLTTEEVLNYTIPNHNIRFEIQWKAKDTAPADAIVYAAILNGTGQPDPNTKVTLVNNGVRYSGYGSVTISKSVYSKWKGTVKVIWECPGEYVDGDGRWTPDYFESEGTASGFIKGGSSYISVSKTGKEQQTPSPRDVVNDYFYSVQKVQPEISREYNAPVSIYDPISSAPAPKLQVTTLQLQSGSIYDKSMAAMKKATQTDNVLVFDITARDTDGKDIHQLGGMTEIKLPLPESYKVQAGNTPLVYYLPGDGTAVPCDTTYVDGESFLTFRTDHLSLYAVSEVAKAPEPPKQPDMPADPPTNPVQPDTPPVAVEPPAPKPPADPGSAPTPPEGGAVIPTTPVEPPQPIKPPDAPVNPTAPAVPPADAPVNPTIPAVPPADAPLTPTDPPADAGVQQPPTPISPAAPEAPAKPIAPAEPEETTSLPAGILAAAAAVIAAALVIVLAKKRKK